MNPLESPDSQFGTSTLPILSLHITSRWQRYALDSSVRLRPLGIFGVLQPIDLQGPGMAAGLPKYIHDVRLTTNSFAIRILRIRLHVWWASAALESREVCKNKENPIRAVVFRVWTTVFELMNRGGQINRKSNILAIQWPNLHCS